MATRITEAQAALFGIGKGPAKHRAQRARPAGQKTPEAQVTEQCIGWLRMQGWTCTRRQSGTFRGCHNPDTFVHIGEKGEADWFCMRPTPYFSVGSIEAFSLELKAPGKSPSTEQIAWGRKQKALGFLWTWADDLDTLRRWVRSTFG